MTAPRFAAMPECTHCGECCGPVTATHAEAARIRRLVERKRIAWVEHADPLTCGFYQNARCQIYSERPIACRMYGVVREMPCPFFPKAGRQSLPAREAVARGWMNPDDLLLADYFAPGGSARMMRGLELVSDDRWLEEKAIRLASAGIPPDPAYGDLDAKMKQVPLRRIAAADRIGGGSERDL